MERDARAALLKLLRPDFGTSSRRWMDVFFLCSVHSVSQNRRANSASDPLRGFSLHTHAHRLFGGRTRRAVGACLCCVDTPAERRRGSDVALFEPCEERRAAAARRVTALSSDSLAREARHHHLCQICETRRIREIR